MNTDGITQRWINRTPCWTHEAWHHTLGREPGFASRHFEVAELRKDGPKKNAPADTPRGFIKTHHYTGSYPSALRRYGLFHGPMLVGVAVLSSGANKATLKKYLPDLEPYAESMELGRLVLLDGVPAMAESWFVARVLEVAGTDGIRGLVSMADPEPVTTLDGRMVMGGHLGIVYQATNATYHGKSTPRTRKVLPDGTTFNDRARSKARAGEQGEDYAEDLLVAHGARQLVDGEDRAEWLQEAMGQARVRNQRHHGNHAYVFRLGSKRERDRIRLGMPVLPYPRVRIPVQLGMGA